MDVPDEFKLKDVCVKWEMIEENFQTSSSEERFLSEENLNNSTENNDHFDNDTYCWTLDNVAVVTKETLSEPIMEDFDPFLPSNWLFFPGATIKVCSLRV